METRQEYIERVTGPRKPAKRNVARVYVPVDLPEGVRIDYVVARDGDILVQLLPVAPIVFVDDMPSKGSV